MALSLVDVGTTANDGTGDPLRTAFQTVNTALTAVNNAVVVGTGVTTFKDDSGSVGVSVLADGSVGINDSTPNFTLDVNGTGRFVDGLQLDTTMNLYGNVELRPTSAAFVRHRVANQALYFGVTNSGSTLYYPILLNASTDELTFSNSTSQCAEITAGGDFTWNNAGATTGMTWDASANTNAGGLGIGTATPTEQLDLSGDAIRIRTSQTPASASATGVAGTICWDTNYIYVCTATNTWKRSAIATW